MILNQKLYIYNIYLYEGTTLKNEGLRVVGEIFQEIGG